MRSCFTTLSGLQPIFLFCFSGGLPPQDVPKMFVQSRTGLRNLGFRGTIIDACQVRRKKVNLTSRAFLTLPNSILTGGVTVLPNDTTMCTTLGLGSTCACGVACFRLSSGRPCRQAGAYRGRGKLEALEGELRRARLRLRRGAAVRRGNPGVSRGRQCRRGFRKRTQREGGENSNRRHRFALAAEDPSVGFHWSSTRMGKICITML